MQLMLEESIKLAARFKFGAVELEHLLYVVARDDRFLGHHALKRAGIDPAQIVSRLSEWLVSVAGMAAQRQSKSQIDEDGKPVESDFEKYTEDLTALAEDNELDVVIGREAELESLIHILLRRRKNNPLLIGEPGVGKTAIVEGLAQRIVQNKVPAFLQGKRLVMLDLSAVVAGTVYRGQFEERLKNIISEVVERGDTILFVDEIHTLSGTGSSEGGFDAANILKPALARGELSLIGATTYEEYRKHIRKDKALDRRFQVVQVQEPSSRDAIQMLRGTRRALESHHHVSITDEAIRSAVELASRYIHDRFLPDKAIDVLDEAATYHAEPAQREPELASLQKEIALTTQQKVELVERASTPEEWELARELAEKETQLMRQLQKLQTAKSPREKKRVTAEEVARVISNRTGIPLEQINQSLEPLNVKRIQKVMQKHLFGQDQAIQVVSRALMRAQLGLQPEKKPIGSFLLVGPTGVGKTETARILAEQVFGDREALIKVDMSEYMERHTVSNLIGAPAGYVGFEQGGSLTEQVGRRPYSVVLFDEVEKAHPDVFNILLQILEDGTLTDNTGRHTSFEHTIIIMTSNLGLTQFTQAARIGFSATDETSEEKQAALKDTISKEIKTFFRPELLGRLSGIIFYEPLTESVVAKLVKRRMQELIKSFTKRGITLSLCDTALPAITKRYQPESGARSVDRVFMSDVEPPIIQAILDHPGVTDFTLTTNGDEIQAVPSRALKPASE
jgi:ATP-dependent Clp protease ATP-binding subunit ClpC